MKKQKLKILFLDDQEERHRSFLQRFGSDRIFQAYSANEAIRLLKEESPFDAVFLDHDLGGFFLPSDDTSGYAVACYIANMKENMLPKTITVHSWNEEGALRMLECLRAAAVNVTYEPFS